MRRALAPLAALLLLAGGSAAQDDPYGGTYTPEELAALDRALHVANLDRRDLAFDKALTEGHGCFPVVKQMLRDPLSIASEMDELAAAAGADAGAPVRSAVLEATEPLEVTVPSVKSPVLEMGDPDRMLASLAALASLQPPFTPGQLGVESAREMEAALDALRARLPAQMAWHEVFSSPYEGDRQAAAEKWGEGRPDALLVASDGLVSGLAVHWLQALGGAEDWWRALTPESFPTDAPRIVETEFGRVGLGTPGDDVYEGGEFAILIDPGGNDRYIGCRIGAAYGVDGRRVGLFADLGGDDVYECADVNINLGAAVLGVAAFYDLGAGNDRYVAGHATLGAAMAGVATFYDDGGTDVYEGRTYTQGAAGFGIGVFMDDSVQEEPETSTDEGTKEPVTIGLFDNDRLSAWGNAQAFARPRAVALCINRRGNDIYEAGGVYLHAPLFSDRYQSFSQGFAIGERGVDWAGGLAMLIDHDGNDRYLGDIYNQGVGYWYGAGLLWDGGGNDTYEMTQYGQGSGIHLAVGGLVDVAGHDTYVMHSGLGQGGSHDYAASILHDRDGNDRYHGSTSCNGCGLTNSVGIQIDREGNDTYGARRKNGVNFGRPARDFPSIGVLVDLSGTDDYLGEMTEGSVWRHTDIGVGIDITPPQDEGSTGTTPAADQPSGEAVVPEICSYEGELTQEVFDELWEISVRWEVGDNRVIVPKARERLIAFGPAVLPMLDAKVETDSSGLELRAFVDVLRGIADGGARDDVLALIRRNGVEGNERRRRVALHLIGELELAELSDVVVTILEGDDDGLARRAAGVLPKLDSSAGNDVLLGWLSGGDARSCAAAVSTLVALEADVYPELRTHLASADFAVRGRLVTLLARHLDTYGPAIVRDLIPAPDDIRHIRSLLDVLARGAKAPPTRAARAVSPLLRHRDEGVRADAARVVRAWQAADPDMATLPLLLEAVERMAIDDRSDLVRTFAAPNAASR